MSTLALVLSVFAPAGAAAAAALAPGRPVRRVLWFALMAVGLAAAGSVLAEVYRGDPPVYRSFRPGLLPATIVASLHAGVLLVGLRAIGLSRNAERLALAGLGIGAAGTAACAFTTSAAVLALFLPLPTLGMVAAMLAGGRRAIRAPGLAGLAVADAVALLGLVYVIRRTDSNVLGGGAPDAAGWLLLASAAVKSGAVPWMGAWSAGDGVPGARLAQVSVRAQGLVLLALIGVTLRPSLDPVVLAGVAGGLALGCGLSSLARGRGLAGVSGLAACAGGLALALGGGVGIRALAVLVPAFPLLWGAALLLAVPAERAEEAEDAPPRQIRPLWAVLAPLALGGILASLALLPLTAGFPGAALATSLAATRGTVDPTWLFPAAALLGGIALAVTGALRTVRDAVPGPASLAGLAVAAGSLYAGVASGPLALGWLARLEREVGSVTVLPSVGAPVLPAAPALRLVMAAAPVLALVGIIVVLGRGVRPSRPTTQLPPSPRRTPEPPGDLGVSPRDQVRFVVLSAARGGVLAGRIAGRLRDRGVAWAVVAVAEAMAGLLVVRMILDAAGRGFL